MGKSVFVSCVYEDSSYIKNIERWAKGGLLGNDVNITAETEDKRSQGKEAIKNHIKNKIRGAAVVVVLNGNDTHNHDWIKAEVELANSFHKKLVCMQVPNTKGALPPILKNYDRIPFHPNNLKLLL